MSNDVLIVIADGIFSHGYSQANIYIVDIDEDSADGKIGAQYNPSTDLQNHVSLEEIDRKFGTEFSDPIDSCMDCRMPLERCSCNDEENQS